MRSSIVLDTHCLTAAAGPRSISLRSRLPLVVAMDISQLSYVGLLAGSPSMGSSSRSWRSRDHVAGHAVDFQYFPATGAARRILITPSRISASAVLEALCERAGPQEVCGPARRSVARAHDRVVAVRRGKTQIRLKPGVAHDAYGMRRMLSRPPAVRRSAQNGTSDIKCTRRPNRGAWCLFCHTRW